MLGAAMLYLPTGYTHFRDGGPSNLKLSHSRGAPQAASSPVPQVFCTLSAKSLIRRFVSARFLRLCFADDYPIAAHNEDVRLSHRGNRVEGS
jgi:hypothetical protein